MIITFQGLGEIERVSSLGLDSPLDVALERCGPALGSMSRLQDEALKLAPGKLQTVYLLFPDYYCICKGLS